MSTSADIVRRALKRLGTLASGEDPSAREAEDGILALNGMIASWQASGVDVSADVPLASKFEKAVVDLLAVELAPEYGMAVPAQVQADADHGWTILLAAYLRVPNAQFDDALVNMPAQRPWVSQINPALWLPKEDYAVGDVVQYASRVYECTTAGTSGSTTGPTEMDSSVTDGTVVWSFDRVL